MSYMRGIEWGDFDPAIDWRRYRKGVTIAAMRWMLDHEAPGLTDYPMDEVLSGRVDTLYHDIHIALSGKYAGALIMPEPIATNLYAILDDQSASQD